MNHKDIYDMNALSESSAPKQLFISRKERDEELLRGLSLGNEKSFDSIFKLYYKDLILYAGTYLYERQVCEDIVQSLFMQLWHDREKLVIGTSLKSYLLMSVRNRCFDYVRHQYVQRDYFDYVAENSVLCDSDTESYLLYSELHNHIKEAINKLPRSQREVFVLSRIKGIKYKDIAQRLNISERTVEVRISEALKKLRILLRDFFIFLY